MERTEASGGSGRRRAIVPDEAGGYRVDRFLAGLDEVGSRAAAERLLLAGEVLVDGAAPGKSERLRPGQTVEYAAAAAPTTELVPVDLALSVPYEDEALLVVDKPAGLVTHPARGVREPTLVHGLLARGIAGGADPERPGIVHRLDRDTSGLLVVARTPEAHRRLQDALRARDLERRYVALVHGRPPSRTGTVDAPIGRDPLDPARMAIEGRAARDAVTHFEVEEALPEFTLLGVRLETGRTHQIRVHLAAIEHPVAGDPLYGRPGHPLGLQRQFLHAARLAFDHPLTGERIDLRSPLPDDLEVALAVARAG